jgi:rubredoxin
MQKFKCNMCDYIYDPAKGQPAMGIKSNTRWEDVPDDWRCPVCGASKEQFKPAD